MLSPETPYNGGCKAGTIVKLFHAPSLKPTPPRPGRGGPRPPRGCVGARTATLSTHALPPLPRPMMKGSLSLSLSRGKRNAHTHAPPHPHFFCLGFFFPPPPKPIHPFLSLFSYALSLSPLSHWAAPWAAPLKASTLLSSAPRLSRTTLRSGDTLRPALKAPSRPALSLASAPSAASPSADPLTLAARARSRPPASTASA